MDWHKGMQEVRDMQQLDRMGVPERHKAAEHMAALQPTATDRLAFWEQQAARGTSGEMVWGILADWRRERGEK